MNGLEKELRKISKSLSGLAKKLEQAAARAGSRKQVARRQPPKKTKARKSGPDMIMAIIKASKKGVATAALRAKTGFGSQRVRSIVYELSKRGKIQRIDRGLYRTVK
jgi:hypothetical protein